MQWVMHNVQITELAAQGRKSAYVIFPYLEFN